MIFLLGLGYFFVIVLSIAFTIFLCMVPGIIAKSRGITDSERTTIIVLAWCGLLTMFITWWIALVLALVWQPKTWVNKEKPKVDNVSDLDDLQKLHKLYKSGALTQKEYENLKKDILKDM